MTRLVDRDQLKLTEHDLDELDKFTRFCRLVHQARQAGVSGDEAARAIYPDVYETRERSDG